MSRAWMAVLFVAAVALVGLLVRHRGCARPDATAIEEPAVMPSPCPSPASCLDASRAAYSCGAAKMRCDLTRKGCDAVASACAGVDVGDGMRGAAVAQ